MRIALQALSLHAPLFDYPLRGEKFPSPKQILLVSVLKRGLHVLVISLRYFERDAEGNVTRLYRPQEPLLSFLKESGWSGLPSV